MLVLICRRQVINAHKVCPECSAPGKPFVLRGEEWKVHLTSKIHKRCAQNALTELTAGTSRWVA